MIFSLSKSYLSAWRNAVVYFSIGLLWILFLFWNTFSGMVSIWARSETFTHGFLVLPIVFWLVWRKRDLLLSKSPKPNYLFLFPIIVISIVWLLGDLVSINSVTQLAATALVVLLVIAVFGWSAASVIAFPLGFLFFAVPLGEFLLPVLMDWTAKFTVIAIRLSGVPVYQEGLQFVISSGNWSVVEACSGVRYLISSFMIGTLYAYLNYQSLSRRLIFVGISIIVPVLANWMRAYFIVMLGHFSENKLAVGFDHLIYGWVFFGVVIMLMFLIGSRWTEAPDSNSRLSNMPASEVDSKGYFFGLIVLLIGFAVSVPVSWGKFISSNVGSAVPILSSPYELSGSWVRADTRLPSLKPIFQGSSADISATFDKNLAQVGLYISYYRNQNYASKLVSSENSVISAKSKEWRNVGVSTYVVPNVVTPFSVRVTDLRALRVLDQVDDKSLQVWQFYWVNGSFTSSDYKAKIYGAMQRLLGGGDDSAIIVLYAKDDDNGSAKKSMEDFLGNNYSEIRKMLEKTREQ